MTKFARQRDKYKERQREEQEEREARVAKQRVVEEQHAHQVKQDTLRLSAREKEQEERARALQKEQDAVQEAVQEAAKATLAAKDAFEREKKQVLDDLHRHHREELLARKKELAQQHEERRVVLDGKEQLVRQGQKAWAVKTTGRKETLDRKKK